MPAHHTETTSGTLRATMRGSRRHEHARADVEREQRAWL